MKRTYLLLAIAIVGIAAALLLPRYSPKTTIGVEVAAPVPHVTARVPTVATTLGSLNVKARPARRRILAGGDDLDVVYEISAPSSPDGKRLPVDFALVFDRSGSMSGDPLAKAKQAAQALVEKLLPADRLAIVDFGSESHLALGMTAMTETGRATAQRVIAGINADGSTNTSSALQMAERVMLDAGAREEAVRRIVLLSDGRANQGILGQGLVELAGELNKEHMRVSALGLGLDFDETLMASMADAGGGQYRYLRDADEVAAALSQELAQAASTAASNVTFTLTPKTGVEIREVVGYESVASSADSTVQLSDIAAGELRHVVVHLHVSEGSSGQRNLLSAKLSYQDPGPGHQAHAWSSTTRVEATTDTALVAASVDHDAARTGLRARLGSTILGALGSYAHNDMPRATASLGSGAAKLRAEAAQIGDLSLAAEVDQKAGEASGAMVAAPAPANYAEQKSLYSFGLSASR